MSWKFKDDLGDVEAALIEEMEAAVHDVTGEVFERSQKDVPVASGDLKKSGKIVPDAESSLPGSRGIAAEEIVYEESYSVFVENGYFNVKANRYVKGRRFLSDPLRDLEEQLEQRGLNALDRAFRKAKS